MVSPLTTAHDYDIIGEITTDLDHLTLLTTIGNMGQITKALPEMPKPVAQIVLEYLKALYNPRLVAARVSEGCSPWIWTWKQGLYSPSSPYDALQRIISKMQQSRSLSETERPRLLYEDPRHHIEPWAQEVAAHLKAQGAPPEVFPCIISSVREQKYELYLKSNYLGPHIIIDSQTIIHATKKMPYHGLEHFDWTDLNNEVAQKALDHFKKNEKYFRFCLLTEQEYYYCPRGIEALTLADVTEIDRRLQEAETQSKQALLRNAR